MAKEELKELSFLDLLNSAQIAQRLGMDIQDWMREVVDPHQHTLKYVDRCIEAYKVAQGLSLLALLEYPVCACPDLPAVDPRACSRAVLSS